MRYLSIVAAAWLIVVPPSIAQNTNPPPVPPGTNLSGVSGNTNAPESYSAAEERKAWVLALRKFSESDNKRGLDWTSILGALIPAAVTIGVLILTMRRESQREKERMGHELALKNAEINRQLEIAKLESGTTYADKLLDLRLKQLECFFAPLYALLQQSEGITEKLRKQLYKDAEHYRELDDPKSGPGCKKPQIKWSDGKWYDFRLLDQLPALKQNPVFKPLIDEIIRIGKDMTDLIQKYGAFSVDESGVTAVYGRYLAHYAILRSIYNDPRVEPYPPEQHEVGYYPRELNGIVETRYKRLLQELQPYLQASSAVLAELRQKADTHAGSDK